eukprot:snap_masked-scaffold_21-processed-gene-1.5-mRNA-1 protein AED:1.00 eAED:1.00 QI:0/0/0/0/1/1/2/0/87
MRSYFENLRHWIVTPQYGLYSPLHTLETPNRSKVPIKTKDELKQSCDLVNYERVICFYSMHEHLRIFGKFENQSLSVKREARRALLS